MKRWLINAVWIALLVAVLANGLLQGPVVHAQGSLSVQVLQLLTRVNTWIAKQSFQDLRIVEAAIPSDTDARIYADLSGNLYYDGGLIAGAGGGVTPHNLLSSTHPDTLIGSPVRGSVIVGNSTPKWAPLTVCASGSYLGSNGTDTLCRTTAAGFTAIPAAQITGTAGAFVGTAITALNATQLTSGTVPLARLANLTTAQLSASAGVLYSQLVLTDGLLNADVNSAAAIAYSKLNLTASVVTGDLVAATLLFDRWASNSCTSGQVPSYNGSGWVCTTLAAGGSVTSVDMTVPSFLTLAGNPITTSGSLDLSLTDQLANLVMASPNAMTGTPAFRALVYADLPLSGAAAGSYTKVTVNTAGIVTAGAVGNLSSDFTGALALANGGTGLTAAVDDNVMVGSGTAWVSKLLTNCTTGAITYATSTNTFACSNSFSGLTASVAGAGTLGSVANPFLSLILGTAATNALTITPAAFSAGVVATVTYPGIATATLPLVKRGTIAFTTGAVVNGTCSTPVTQAVTSLAATSTVTASFNTALQTNWKTGVTYYVYATAGNVNLTVCNPTAGSITPETQTFNWTAELP